MSEVAGSEKGVADEQLLALVGAALKRFGTTLTLDYRTQATQPPARCRIAFPVPADSSQSPQGEGPTPERAPLVGNTSKPVSGSRATAGESPARSNNQPSEPQPCLF